MVRIRPAQDDLAALGQEFASLKRPRSADVVERDESAAGTSNKRTRRH